jgi:hypothetical protein
LRTIRFGAGKGVAGNRDQRHRRRALVEQPDRLEAAHRRHEDIDDHQIETGIGQRSETIGTAIRSRDPEPTRLVIDHENATHGGLARRFRDALGTRRRRNGQRQAALRGTIKAPLRGVSPCESVRCSHFRRKPTGLPALQRV